MVTGAMRQQLTQLAQRREADALQPERARAIIDYRSDGHAGRAEPMDAQRWSVSKCQIWSLSQPTTSTTSVTAKSLRLTLTGRDT